MENFNRIAYPQPGDPESEGNEVYTIFDKEGKPLYTKDRSCKTGEVFYTYENGNLVRLEDDRDISVLTYLESGELQSIDTTSRETENREYKEWVYDENNNPKLSCEEDDYTPYETVVRVKPSAVILDPFNQGEFYFANYHGNLLIPTEKAAVQLVSDTVEVEPNSLFDLKSDSEIGTIKSFTERDTLDFFGIPTYYTQFCYAPIKE